MTSISRRKVLGMGATAGLGTAALALVGCGSSGSPAGAGTSAATAPGGGGAAANVKPAAEITFWSAAPAKSQAVDGELIKRFEAKFPDIKVNYQVQGSNYADLANKLAASIPAKTAPDIAMLSDVWWFKYAAAKQIVPLDNLLKNPLLAQAGFDLTDYADTLVKDYQFNNQQWGMPYARSTPLFYYNKQIWADAGLPDRGPDTWDEMDSWAPKIMAKMSSGKSAFTHVKGSSYIAWTFQAIIWEFGGRYSDNKFNMLMNSQQGIDAGNYVRSQVFTKKYAAVTSSDETADFTTGQTASVISSTGGLKGVLDNAKGKFEVGTAFLPKQVQFGCPTGGAGLCIPAASSPENQLAAALFIAFVTNPENTAYYSQGTGYMPVRKSAVNSPTMQATFAKYPQFKTAIEQLAKTQPQDAARVWIPGGDAILGKGLERMILANEDAKNVWPDVVNQLNKAAEPVKKEIGL